jgi:hypothetical protein
MPDLVVAVGWTAVAWGLLSAAVGLCFGVVLGYCGVDIVQQTAVRGTGWEAAPGLSR